MQEVLIWLFLSQLTCLTAATPNTLWNQTLPTDVNPKLVKVVEGDMLFSKVILK